MTFYYIIILGFTFKKINKKIRIIRINELLVAKEIRSILFILKCHSHNPYHLDSIYLRIIF
jgi:hypothetical protein